jgi:hypothetical protein
MTVYAINNDGYKFQELDLTIDDVIDYRPAEVDENLVLDFSIENYAMADWWPTPDTEFVAIDESEGAAIPDLSYWIDASLVLSAKSFRLLGDVLKPWGEFLPLSVRGETYYIFNCLTLVNVNEEKSEKLLYGGEEAGIKSIVFENNEIADKIIFKTRYNSCFNLYCTEYLKNIIEDYDLSGVIFSEKLTKDFN